VAVRIVQRRIENLLEESGGDSYAPDVEFSALGKPLKRGATFVGPHMGKAPGFIASADS
jgi:hypothetical protein